MSVRFYLTDAKAKEFEASMRPDIERPMKDDKGSYFVVEKLNPSNPYLEFVGDKRFQFDDVAFVDWTATIHAGFRADGYYEVAGAHLAVETMAQGKLQVLTAWAKDYLTLKRLVIKVRAGNLQPVLDYTAPAKVELEPVVIDSSTRDTPGASCLSFAIIKLHNALETAARLEMQQISHSIVYVKEDKYWAVTVAGLAPRKQAVKFD